jgi:hypothetical protein
MMRSLGSCVCVISQSAVRGSKRRVFELLEDYMRHACFLHALVLSDLKDEFLMVAESKPVLCP